MAVVYMQPSARWWSLTNKTQSALLLFESLVNQISNPKINHKTCPVLRDLNFLWIVFMPISGLLTSAGLAL